MANFGLKPEDGEHELLVIFLIILVAGLFCWFGWKAIRWDMPPRYSAGETTNAVDVTFGSGYPDGTYVGHDWTAQPFGG